MRIRGFRATLLAHSTLALVRRRLSQSGGVPMALLFCAGSLLWQLPGLEARERAAEFAASTENADATRAAIEQLRAGGNAVDGAVAAALVAGVVNPTSSGLGGGCFITYYDQKTQSSVIIDARETAPSGLVPQEFEGRPFPPEARGKWVGVPGELAGLHEIHARFGKRTWPQVVEPARLLAERGFSISPHMSRSIDWSKSALVHDQGLKSLWLGRALPAGARVKNQKLAKTLGRIAREGPRALYEGAIPAELSRLAQSAGGSLSPQDFIDYRTKSREPLRLRWAGYEIVTMPLPSGGGLMLLQTLAMFSKAELASLGFNSPAYQHLLAEAFRGALADRMRFVTDPDVEATKITSLLSGEHLERRRRMISTGRTHAMPRFTQPEHGTHHLSTMDAEGNAVSLTTTVNRSFGAKLAGPDSGIVLNDELDDFTSNAWVAPFGMTESPNRARPNARPASSMTPTIVLRDGRAVFTAGGSGGMAIGPNVSQAVIAHLTFGLTPAEIVAAPRFQLPFEGRSLLVPADTPRAHVADLERRGEVVGSIRFTGSAVQVIAADGQRRLAAADARKSGSAAVGSIVE